MTHSWYENTARGRIEALLDAGSFEEFLPAQERVVSPHLRQLGTPAAFDDGVIVGRGAIAGRRVLLAAQEGAFMGGAVGEVHGAKIVGLLERALDECPDAVLLLVESGGVRLHEANAGLIAISEIMRAVLRLRGAGVPVLVLDGGQYGCFGGMGIVSRLCDAVIISEEGRLGLSGPRGDRDHVRGRGVRRLRPSPRLAHGRGEAPLSARGSCGAGARQHRGLSRGDARADGHQTRPEPRGPGSGACPARRPDCTLRRLPGCNRHLDAAWDRKPDHPALA